MTNKAKGISQRQKKKLKREVDFIKGLQKDGWKIKCCWGSGSQLHNELPSKIKENQYIVEIVLQK